MNIKTNSPLFGLAQLSIVTLTKHASYLALANHCARL